MAFSLFSLFEEQKKAPEVGFSWEFLQENLSLVGMLFAVLFGILIGSLKGRLKKEQQVTSKHVTLKLKQKRQVSELEKWLGTKGECIWEPGCFRENDPVKAVCEAFTGYCQEFHPKPREKDSVAAWALWQALCDLEDTLLESQEACGQLEENVQELKQKCETVQKQNEEFTRKEVDFTTERCRWTTFLRDVQAQRDAALDIREKLEMEVNVLRKDLENARTAARFLADQNRSAKAIVSHEKCEKKIKRLEEQLALHQGLVAAVQMEEAEHLWPSVSFSAEPEPTPLPRDAIPETPFNPDWQKPQPVAPIVVKHVDCQGGRGGPVQEEVGKEKVSEEKKCPELISLQ